MWTARNGLVAWGLTLMLVGAGLFLITAQPASAGECSDPVEIFSATFDPLTGSFPLNKPQTVDSTSCRVPSGGSILSATFTGTFGAGSAGMDLVIRTEDGKNILDIWSCDGPCNTGPETIPWSRTLLSCADSFKEFCFDLSFMANTELFLIASQTTEGTIKLGETKLTMPVALATIPEPSALLLLGSGIAAVALLGRKKRVRGHGL